MGGRISANAADPRIQRDHVFMVVDWHFIIGVLGNQPEQASPPKAQVGHLDGPVKRKRPVQVRSSIEDSQIAQVSGRAFAAHSQGGSSTVFLLLSDAGYMKFSFIPQS